MQKAYLRVTALEYIDWQPGFLVCELLDRHGKRHEFEEKVPVVCGVDSQHGKDDLYPIEITLNCVVIEIFDKYYLISTELPYQISTKEGISEFEVNKEQIIFAG